MSVDPEKKREGGGRSRWTLGGPYHVFPHLHNEKDGEGYEKRLLKVLEARCVPCREYGAAHEWQLETKLADRGSYYCHNKLVFHHVSLSDAKKLHRQVAGVSMLRQLKL